MKSINLEIDRGLNDKDFVNHYFYIIANMDLGVLKILDDHNISLFRPYVYERLDAIGKKNVENAKTQKALL